MKKTLCNNNDIVEFAQQLSQALPAALGVVRLDEGNETAVIPFTRAFGEATLHYCREEDLSGYLHCNGEGCLLCRTGRRSEKRLLFPVYVPDFQSVGVLPVSLSNRPKALLPQLAAALSKPEASVLFILREGMLFAVTAAPLKPGCDDGAEVITNFVAEFEAGKLALDSVFPRVSNEHLARIPAIARRAQLKGLSLQ